MATFRVLTLPLYLFATGALLFASPAGAQSKPCTADADCGQGFECTEYAMGCADMPAPACPPGEECFAPEPMPCEAETFAECTPLKGCSADSDCADGMVCHTSTESECSGGGAGGSSGSGAAEPAPGADPAAPPPGGELIAPPECTTSTVTQCVPKYMLGCTVAADCGDGFDCVPEQPCWCNGSSAGSGGETDPAPGAGGMISSDPAAPMLVPPSEPDCGCTNGPNNVCQARELPCTMNAECPAGWLCKEVGGYERCSGEVRPEPGAGGGAAEMPIAPPECTSVPGQLVCVPPYFDEGFGRPGSVLGSEAGSDGSGQEGKGSTENSGPPPSSGAPGGENPMDPEDGDDEGSSDASSGDDGGCQVSAGRVTSSPTSLLALLGLAGLLGRRRRAA